ncbi:MAG TPA: hypothetical protein VGK34_09695 [Armatimonadota bacterium]
MVEVRCSWWKAQADSWQPAAVTPLISETGLGLATNEERGRWVSGVVTERRAAGLTRTVIFDPYPEAQRNGLVDADFLIEISAPGKSLSTYVVHLTADNTDVVYLTDWSNVLQKDLISTSPATGKWMLSDDPSGAAKTNRVQCSAGTPVPALTYPLNLKGNYALYVSTDPNIGPISLRLSGDERSEKISSSAYEREKLWRWTSMDREHLVVKQAHYYTGYTASSLNYVKLVPLSRKSWDNLKAEYAGKHDKFYGAYFEPYSWAFYNDVKENYQHREPLTAYQEGMVDLIDVGCGRFGAKSVFETRKADQLIYSTEGDPIEGQIPVTDNVGRMQQYTNTLETELKYASELGMGAHAQFGATACYPGTALESAFSKAHPDWRRNDSLLLSVPGVRKYMLDVYREALEVGAPGVSIDFCRYPDGIDSVDDCTKFMRDLRKVADEFGRARGKHVTILVRFPSTGTRKWQCFDYRTWAREGLVDYLCPSNLQGVYQFFDIKPYLNAVKGTKCKLTPEMDGCEWGPVPPGVMYWRAKQLYDAGADGVYIYQADGIINNTWLRRVMSRLGSSEAIDRWLRKDADMRSHCSKGIYLLKPADGRAYGFYDRAQIWVEGVDVREMETYMDGKLVGRMSAPPYLLGTDGYESDKVVPVGDHKLLVRVKDGAGWLEQEFAITGQ